MKFLVDINEEGKYVDPLAAGAALEITLFTAGLKCTVRPNKEIPEVRKIEMGLLKLPAMVNYIVVNYNDMKPPIENFKLRTGDLVELSKYPDLRPYCDPNSIRAEWDFSSIPVGSLIRIDGASSEIWDVGYFQNIDGDMIKIRSGNHHSEEWSSDNIKSIRIVELPKDGE